MRMINGKVALFAMILTVSIVLLVGLSRASQAPTKPQIKANLHLAVNPNVVKLKIIEGVYVNVDKNTRGITKVEISNVREIARSRLQGKETVRGKRYLADVKVWASCSPTDCYWGETTATILSSNPFNPPYKKLYGILLSYDQGFANREILGKFSIENLTALTAKPPKIRLTLMVMNFYKKPSDTRYDSVMTYQLEKVNK